MVVLMPAELPTIVATSIGFDSRGRDRYDWEAGPIFDLTAELSGATGTPKVCFLGTATGDNPTVITSVYSALANRFRASHVELFAMPNIDDVRGHLLSQDVIWVGGGSVANLLALWRLHGWDEYLHEAWQAGVVLGGVSAGSICWHNGGTTDSFGPQLRPVTNGLGWLPYSNGVHYNSELQRRPLFHRLVADGTLTDGYATDDGVGIVYRGTEMIEAVADRPDCAAYRVVRGSDGAAEETVIEPRMLR
jgi:peptidase E